MELAVSTHTEGDAIVVDVRGEVDIYTASLLRTALDQEITKGHHRIVLDLSSLAFLDSTGLGVLVGRLRLVRLHGGWIKIACTSDRINRLFQITGLDKVFPIYESVEAALAA